MASFELNEGGPPRNGNGEDADPDEGAVKTKRARAGKGAMDRDEFVGAFRLACSDAEEFIDGHIAPLRAVATQFYRGEPFGNEEKGRSQIVMTEVRDSVQGILPALLRVLTSGETPVEFVPTNAGTIELADQQTQYVSHVFMHDNPGFLILHNMLKDGLVRKLGVVKWRWSDDNTVTETAFTGLVAEQVAVLQEGSGIEILEITHGEEIPAPPTDPVPGPDGQPSTAPAPPQPPTPTFDVRIRRKVPKHRCVIECVPPEEYLVARDARSEDMNAPGGASFQAHRAYRSVSDIVAMGYDEKEIEEHMGGGDAFQLNYEMQTRNPAVLSFMNKQDSPDKTQRQVLFIEAYMRVDKDGDGFAELRKIHAIGNAYHILHDEVVEEAPFATFCPDPEPHMVFGQSIFDQTGDLQLIKSNMVRALLDSLAGSIHPRTVVVEGQVNLDDAMNTEQGAIIRAKQVAAVQELVKPFVGQGALPVIAYMDQVKAKRTGVSDASQGLDPAVLQSTAQNAVQATVSGAQERIELYTRICAETFMKRLFKGVAKCLRENQDQERVIKLSGQWVPVNPKSWDGELECTPNVALGVGSNQERMNILGLIISKIEQIMQVLGPVNPLAGIDRYRAALAQYVTLAGHKDAAKYFGQISPQYMQQLQQGASQPQPNPQMEVVKLETEKAKAEMALKVAKFQQEQFESAQQEARERYKILMNTLVGLVTAESAHGQAVDFGMIDRLMQHENDVADRQAAHAQAIHGNLTGLASDVQGQQTQAQVDHAGNQMNAQAMIQAAREKAASAPTS